MSSPAPFAPIAELLGRNLSIRHVYGDPVQRGETTVIPVAKVALAFGAGGGQGPRRNWASGPAAGLPGGDSHADAQGGGGGAVARVTPIGALELGPGGTRFIRLHPLTPWLGGAVLGLAAGWLTARLRLRP